MLIRLPDLAGGPPRVLCPEHGEMAWRDLEWACEAGGCPVRAGEADLARLARWLAGENCGAGYGDD